MKKAICLLTAVILSCMGATAFAAQVPEKYEHLWISENGEECSVDVMTEDGRTDVFALFSLPEGELLSVEFGKCSYDAEKDALICEGGVLTREMITETDNDTDESDEDTDDTAEDEGVVITSEFGATLTVDENGVLLWTGSGDALADRTFVNGDEEDDGVFTGDWEFGDEAGMIIGKHGDQYSVSIVASTDNITLNEWEYVCTMDANGALTGTGVKTVTVFGGNDEVVSEKEVYADGAAIFTADSGAILWNDAKEDAGKSMRFERVEDEPEEQF